MKRTFSLVLAALVALCLTACGSGQTQPQSSAEPQAPAEAVSGGWEIPAVSEAVSLPQEVQEGFDKAAEQLDRYGQNEHILEALAREELAENGNWCSFQRDNAPELNL